MKFVVVDIETTGLTPEANEIIEIGAVVIEPKGKTKALTITKTYQQLIKPYHEIPPVVRNLTGIDHELLKDSPRFRDIAADFLKFVGNAVFVAHNAQFDLRMINTSLERINLKPLPNPWIDTQDFIALAFPTLPSHRLGDVVESLNIETENLHRALADAQATAKILIKTIEHFTEMPLPIIYQWSKLLAQLDIPLNEIIKDIVSKKTKKLKIAQFKELNHWQSIIQPKNKFKKSVYAKESDEDEETPIEPKIIDDYFSENGKMQEIFPNYEQRPQQTSLSKTILQSFNNTEHCLIEAGTGTGKSAAYLLPVFLWIEKNGGPIIVSTRTKNLQAQLIDKDIPLILKLFPKNHFQILLLKGRQNYICLRKFELLLQQMIMSKSKEIVKLLPLFTWLSETQEGDLSELHSSIEKKYGHQLNSDSASCIGERCSYCRHCFVQFVRRQAFQADVIIANHALVFTDASQDNSLLPHYTKVILDEAHTIEDALTDAYSVSVGFGLFTDEIKKIDLALHNSESLSLSEDIKSELREFFSMLYACVKKLNTSGSDNKLPIKRLRDSSDWSAIDLVRYSITKILKKYLAALNNLLETTDDEIATGEIKAGCGILDKLWTAAFDICEETVPNSTQWILLNNGKEPYNVLLQMSPINVGEILQEHFFSTKQSVIMTSATLTVGGNFDYFKQRFGIDRNTEQRFVFEAIGSPYKYEDKMLCTIPDDLLPLSSEKEYILHIAEYLADVFHLMNGRTMVLFTSYKMLETTHRYIKPLADDLGISIICQGLHGSRRSLVSRFKNNKKTVLFGTSSFWEGVDIQGEALSCVIIVKLPFAVPSEPITKARADFVESSGGNAFYDYSVPQAVIKFKQGIGRLIRSHQDNGIVMIIDERIFSKNYGKVFMQSMPPCEIYKGPKDMVLKKIRAWM